MNGSKLIVFNEQPRAIDFALQQAANEGWNPGLNDRVPFYAADPNGFFIACLDSDPIACASAVCYSDDFAFFGFYVVLPPYRGQGYGLQLTQKRLDYVSGRNIGLDGVIENESIYNKIGFKTDFVTQRYRMKWQAENLLFLNECLVPLNEIPFDILNDYDQRYFPAPRPDFLRAWVSQTRHVGTGYLRNNTLLGYGVIRPCIQGYKIGPLFAESTEVAKAILYDLLASTPKSEILIDVPNPNLKGFEIIRPFKPEKVYACARMYTQEAPALALENIFGLTTFELG